MAKVAGGVGAVRRLLRTGRVDVGLADDPVLVAEREDGGGGTTKVRVRR